MEFKTTSFRHGLSIVRNEPGFHVLYKEITDVISGISEDELRSSYNTKDKSLSIAINELLKTRLTNAGWAAESAIFQDEEFTKKRESTWRLDFAKELISVEVSFNHGEAIAWNLLKPTIAGELNHVQKAIQTEVGIIICATHEMKEHGGFDNAVGDYEKIMKYLRALRNVLTVPLVIIGLEAPKTFMIKTEGKGNARKSTIIDL
jgi:hypothetical protein